MITAEHVVVKTKCTSSTSMWFQLFFFPVSLIMCILLRANKRQFPYMIFTAFLTTNAYFLGTSTVATSLHISNEFAVIIASIIAAVSSNTIGRFTDVNAFNPLVPLMLFVGL